MALPPCHFLTAMSFSHCRVCCYQAVFGRVNWSYAQTQQQPNSRTDVSLDGRLGATEGEISMQRKILALAAAAALGAVMTTGAMAAHVGGGGGGRGMSMGGGGGHA